MEDYELKAMQMEGQPPPVVLYEDDKCAILDCVIVKRLWLHGPWHSRLTGLARQFGVQYLELDELGGWNDESIDFLDQLPGLNSIRIDTSRKLDWRPVERQGGLE